MIGKAVFPVEEWRVREASLNLDLLGQTESVLALSNGHIGLRGNLDEGEPHVIAGTYLNSFYDQRPLPYPESGYGYPEQGQTVVNVTDGKLIRLMVDDEPFHVAHGRLIAHERRPVPGKLDPLLVVRPFEVLERPQRGRQLQQPFLEVEVGPLAQRQLQLPSLMVER
jgi:glycosyl hydrolase family 65